MKFVGFRVFLFFCVITLILFAFASSNSFSINIIYGFLTLLPLMFSFLSRKSVDVFEPIFVLLIFCVFGVLYRLFVISINPAELSDMIQLAGTYDISPGLLLALLFNSSFALAYTCFSIRVKVPSVPSFFVYRLKKILFLLLIFSAIYLVHTFLLRYNVYSGIFSGNLSSKKLFNIDGERDVQGYFRLGEVIFWSIFIVSYTKTLAGNKKFKNLWIFSALIVVAFNVLTSSRITLLNFLLVGMIIRSFYFRKIFSIKLLALGLSLVLCVTYMTGARGAQNANTIFSWGNSFSLVSEQLSKDTYSYTIDKALIVTERVPSETPFLMGESLIAPLYAPIPRDLWPDKPLIRPGPIFAAQVFNTRNERTGIPPSFPVETYWNFGWIGVILGGSLIGSISGVIYKGVYPLRRKKITIQTINNQLSQDKKNISGLQVNKNEFSRKIYEMSVIRYCVFINMFFFPLILGDFSGALISYLESSIFVYLVELLLKSKEDSYAS